MLDPPKAKSLSEIPRLIDAWESKCSRLSAENKQSINNENLRRRTILKMAPKELEKHMAQNGHVFKTYDLARAEMIRYAEELCNDESEERLVGGDEQHPPNQHSAAHQLQQLPVEVVDVIVLVEKSSGASERRLVTRMEGTMAR